MLNLLDLIGKEKLQKMQQRFYDVTGFTNACLDIEGNLLSHAGRPEPLCMEIIRSTPLGMERCRELVKNPHALCKHNQSSSEDFKQNQSSSEDFKQNQSSSEDFKHNQCNSEDFINKPSIITCHAGMLDAMIPISVENEKIGFLVIGQFFETPPDKNKSIAYAAEIGTDPDVYWEAVQQAKVIPKNRVKPAVMLLEFMGTEIADMASANLRLRAEIKARRDADIKQRQAEKKLRMQYSFLNTLMETIPNPLFYKDTQGVYIGCNRAFEAYLGKSRHEIIGKTVHDMAYHDISSKYEAKDSELISNPGRQLYEGQVVAYGGNIRDVLFNKATFTNDQGDVAGIIGVITDITEIKENELALMESEEKVRTLVEQARDAIYLSDSSGNLLMVNQRACDSLGYTRKELLGMSVADVEVAISPRGISNLFKSLAMGETTPLRYGVHRKKDGSVFPVEVAINCFFAGGNTVYLGIARDITKQKEAEAKQRDLIKELKRALAEIKQLSGLLPICASCKKIRDDKGYWNRIEAYIQERSNAKFTHGICPDCMDQLYGNEEWYSETLTTNSKESKDE
ncbi:hypothetical protein MTBBW1_1140006 [Desulfamplus magnetovallimortis]|uniref:Uncharacterized protein n=1 Tax=Desulfamplus magnetovallimortis TaxID=1246637 RepID=A0A1W1H5V4_9BACT|nr:PAS domain S-box protein [Desulfamplus magnetovallimortis]SLM27816.1 hypothetical protein MTBBW1_1140006 [Desulfamplus magnetovallimortis]